MNIQLISIAIVIAIIFLVYLLIKINKKIRIKAYELFLEAEHAFNKTKSGKEKMQYVVSNVYAYVPAMFKIFISEEMFGKLVQKLFDEIKDLLDDGKRNKSTKGEK